MLREFSTFSSELPASLSLIAVKALCLLLEQLTVYVQLNCKV